MSTTCFFPAVSITFAVTTSNLNFGRTFKSPIGISGITVASAELPPVDAGKVRLTLPFDARTEEAFEGSASGKEGLLCEVEPLPSTLEHPGAPVEWPPVKADALEGIAASGVSLSEDIILRVEKSLLNINLAGICTAYMEDTQAQIKNGESFSYAP